MYKQFAQLQHSCGTSIHVVSISNHLEIHISEACLNQSNASIEKVYKHSKPSFDNNLHQSAPVITVCMMYVFTSTQGEKGVDGDKGEMGEQGSAGDVGLMVSTLCGREGGSP